MKYFITLCIALLCNTMYSQETNKKLREVGLQTSNLSSFAFSLKKGNDNKYIKYRLFTTNGSFNFENGSSDSLNIKDNQGNLGLGFGFTIERRKSLSEKISLFNGPDFTVSGSYHHQNVPTSIQYSNYIPARVLARRQTHSYSMTLGFGWNLGMMHDINEKLYMSASVTPSVRYKLGYRTEEYKYNFSPSRTVTTEYWSHGPIANLTWGATLGVFYRFGA